METGSADAFDRLGTLGIEEEYFVVDDRGRPTSGTDELVYETEPPDVLDGRLDHELFKFVIEAQTPTLDGLDEGQEAHAAMRDALVEHAANHGYRIAAAGLHPVAKWRELEHADKPRYRAQLDRIQYPQHRNTTAGLHIHVGVDDGDKAVWISNQLRWHVPVMLALSANSPYWNGFDTGMASARAKIFEALPNTGMPTAFDGIEDYLRYERTMLETGSINDRGEIWHDVRPHTEYGTVEVRTPDAQTERERAMAFVEYTHALVLDLSERYEDDDPVHDLRRELLDENKWRAMRHGHEASFIAPDGAGEVPLGTVVDRECDRLGIDGIRQIYGDESAATRQRRLRDVGVDELCESLTLSASKVL